MKKEYIYKRFERFWHWTQAMLIMFLGLTGFEIHGSFQFFGFDQAVTYHNTAAIAFLVLIAFAIFWHVTTGEWRQYLPTWTHMRAQMNYYIVGMFQNVAHPTRKTVLSKLNPLQKLVYAGLKVLVIPVMVSTGLIYMFYRYPQQHQITSLNLDGLEIIGLVHTAGAFLLVAFFIAHVYLITTGQTITSNLRAMITGYEELPEEPGKHGMPIHSLELETKA
jgi:thiosulfate reductase cytochrome b subunit